MFTINFSLPSFGIKDISKVNDLTKSVLQSVSPNDISIHL